MLIQRTEALKEKEIQNARAEKNLELALAAINKVILGIAERDIGSDPDEEFGADFGDSVTPNVTSDDAEMLQSLLVFLDELADNNSENLLAQSAEAGRRAGDVYQQLGQLRESQQAYEDALGRYRSLREQNDQSETALIEAEILNQLALIAGLRGVFRSSDEYFQAAKRLLETGDLTESALGRFLLARAYRIQASLGTQTGANSGTGYRRQDMAPGQKFLLKARGLRDVQMIQTAIDIVSELTKQFSDEPVYEVELGRLFREKSLVSSRLLAANGPGQPRAGRRLPLFPSADLQSSLEIFERLYRQNRRSDLICYELCKSLTALPLSGGTASRRLTRADFLMTELTAKSPDLVRYQSLAGQIKESLASNHARNSEFQEAEELLVQALDIYKELMKAAPETKRFHAKTLRTLESLAEVSRRRGDTEKARDYLTEATRLVPKGWLKRVPSAMRTSIRRIEQKLKELG